LEANVKLQSQSNKAVWTARVLTVLLALLLPLALRAQLDSGSITGVVRDSSGAVVPGATITVTNSATGARLVTKSTSTGNYEVSGLPPETYTLEAAAAGFENYVVSGVVVHVQQVLTVDFPLSPGSVTQKVTVTAAAPLLQAQNAAVVRPSPMRRSTTCRWRRATGALWRNFPPASPLLLPEA